jgi:hypothetical protein
MSPYYDLMEVKCEAVCVGAAALGHGLLAPKCGVINYQPDKGNYTQQN